MTGTDITSQTGFSALLDALKTRADHFTVDLPPDWLQGRTAYGGLSAALCLEATRRAFPDLPPLRSAQFVFVGPAAGILRATATVLRQGKSTVFMGADVEGDSGLATRATFCFGAERSSALDHADIPMPEAPPPEACPDYYNWPIRPNFMSHFEGRLAAGSRPNTADAPPQMLVWLRHRDEKVDKGPASLLALADALPPAATILFREPAPISTMTWSVDLLEPGPTSATGWWLVQSTAETARHGYSAQRTVVWNPDGRPVLIARQNVAIFAKG